MTGAETTTAAAAVGQTTYTDGGTVTSTASYGRHHHQWRHQQVRATTGSTWSTSGDIIDREARFWQILSGRRDRDHDKASHTPNVARTARPSCWRPGMLADAAWHMATDRRITDPNSSGHIDPALTVRRTTHNGLA